MEQNPTAIVVNGRDGRGKFAVGNPGGPGNPHFRKVAKLRRAMFAAVTPDDIKAAVAKLVEKALEGDVVAIRELLDRCVGKPATPVTGADGGPLQVQAVDRAVFDVEGFAAQLRQLAEQRTDEANGIKRIDT